MRLFWKLFFTTMFISVGCLAVGGNLLITLSRSAQIEQEVQIAQDYGDIVCYALASKLESTIRESALYNMSGEQDLSPQIAELAASVSIDSMNQKVAFRITDAQATPLFSSLPKSFDDNLLTELRTLSGTRRGWVVKRDVSQLYIQAIRPVRYHDQLFYIETHHNAGSVSETQELYLILLLIMAWTLLPASVITFFTSRFLSRRIVALSRISQAFSGGNLHLRAPVRGSDEISGLSRSFNRMADDLEEKMAALQEEAESRERFVGAFSHELKTPLTSIIGYADLLRRREMSREESRLCAEYIFTEGKRLESLSMRMLDLIVLKQSKLQTIPTSMKRFIAETCTSLLPLLQESGIFLDWDVDIATVELEPDLMKTVLLNIIDNARKSIDDAGRIFVRGQSHPGHYVITVRDTGKGMEEQELAHIREAFYMVDKSRSRSQGGAGLGLAICDQILQLHGFSIAFDSVPGVGTTVTITMQEVQA